MDATSAVVAAGGKSSRSDGGAGERINVSSARKRKGKNKLPPSGGENLE